MLKSSRSPLDAVLSAASEDAVSVCVSAVFFDNPTLAFGDIVGSNMFNIFALAIYNLYFFKSLQEFLYQALL